MRKKRPGDLDSFDNFRIFYPCLQAILVGRTRMGESLKHFIGVCQGGAHHPGIDQGDVWLILLICATLVYWSMMNDYVLHNMDHVQQQMGVLVVK